MARSIAAGSEKFIIGDVWEWAEPDWHEKRKRREKFFNKGERLVTAQICKVDAKGNLHLEVLKCDLVYDQSATGVKMLRAGEVIVRKQSTLKKRKARRIPWAGRDGEATRALTASKFLR